MKKLCSETLKTLINELNRPGSQTVHKWETSQKKAICIRDHQQITFVTFNEFWLLSKPHPPTVTPVLLTYSQYQVGWNAKLNKACLFYIVKKVFYIVTYKKLQDIVISSFYFLLFCINFYIRRYHFLQIFRTWFKIIYIKKDFCHKFTFFNRFTQTYTPPP